MSGRPLTLTSSPPVANLLEYATSTSRSDPLFFPTRFSPTPRVARTNRYPLCGIHLTTGYIVEYVTRESEWVKGQLT